MGVEQVLLGLEVDGDDVVAGECRSERHHPVAGAEVEHSSGAAPDVAERPSPLDLPVAGERPLGEMGARVLVRCRHGLESLRCARQVIAGISRRAN